MADIKELVKKKPDRPSIDVDEQLLIESDKDLINGWHTESKRRAMPQGIRKLYVQNK